MVVEIFWHAARILMLGNKLLCVQTFFWPRRHCVYERASLCVYVHAHALLIFLRVAGDISPVTACAAAAHSLGCPHRSQREPTMLIYAPSALGAAAACAEIV